MKGHNLIICIRRQCDILYVDRERIQDGALYPHHLSSIPELYLDITGIFIFIIKGSAAVIHHQFSPFIKKPNSFQTVIDKEIE
jgi:hypothetical protein